MSAALMNDTSAKCRKLTALAIKSLLQQVSLAIKSLLQQVSSRVINLHNSSINLYISQYLYGFYTPSNVLSDKRGLNYMGKILFYMKYYIVLVVFLCL